MLKDIFTRPVLKPVLKKQLLTHGKVTTGTNLVLAMQWDSVSYTQLRVSDGYYSMQAEVDDGNQQNLSVKERLKSVLAKEVSKENDFIDQIINTKVPATDEPLALVLIKKYAFQIKEEVYTSQLKNGKVIKTRKQVASLVIEEIYKHYLNETVDWLLLKEA